MKSIQPGSDEGATAEAPAPTKMTSGSVCNASGGMCVQQRFRTQHGTHTTHDDALNPQHSPECPAAASRLLTGEAGEVSIAHSTGMCARCRMWQDYHDRINDTSGTASPW